MAKVDERAIRERSYFIWIAAGRPEGRQLAHWLQAEAELASTGPTPGAGKGSRASSADTGKKRATRTAAKKPRPSKGRTQPSP